MGFLDSLYGIYLVGVNAVNRSAQVMSGLISLLSDPFTLTTSPFSEPAKPCLEQVEQPSMLLSLYVTTLHTVIQLVFWMCWIA